MSIRINRYHKLADLSAHRGMLLNSDFGWHADRLACDVTLDIDQKPKARQAKLDRVDRRLRVAGVTVSVVVLVLGLAAIGLL